MSHAISQSLLPEFDMEMANTRRVLERVPEANLGWKPHLKSMSLRQLASHVADMAAWAVITVGQDDFDVSPADGPVYQPFDMDSVADGVRHFDDNYRQARALLDSATDETMARTWSLKSNGSVILAMPKVAAWRTFVMNHLIHHRAQLIVYLRLNDVPVPGLYGPSADEQ
jgi:uncharacterized damage-inducible protein DinB